MYLSPEHAGHAIRIMWPNQSPSILCHDNSIKGGHAIAKFGGEFQFQFQLVTVKNFGSLRSKDHWSKALTVQGFV